MPIKSIVDDDPYVALDPDGNVIGSGSKKDKRYVEIEQFAIEHGIYGEYRIIQPEVKVTLIATSDVVGTTPPNSPPAWSGVLPMNWTAGVGGTANILNVVTDPDGDAMTITHDATSTALPTNVSVAGSGLVTATNGVGAGTTNGVRFIADDGVNSPVTSPNMSIVINAAAGVGKRWNPGHYVRTSGTATTSNQSAYWDSVIASINTHAAASQMKGSLVWIAWGRVNPTGGQFNFDDINRMLDALAVIGNKKLCLLMTYKNFGTAGPGLHAPADLFNQIVQSNSGWTAAIWRDGTGGFPDVKQRFIDCMVAVVNEFDSHPLFEMLVQVEGNPSFANNPPGDYSHNIMAAALKDIYTDVMAATSKMNYAPLINSLSTSTLPGLMEKCFEIGSMTGHPDARPTPGWNMFENVPGSNAIRDYRNILGCIDLASPSTLINKANFDIDVIINNEQNHQTTHLAWTTFGTLPGDTWAEILTGITADPTLHTACPTIYSACDV